MNRDEMFAAIEAQRSQLATTLEGLSESDWNAASLCQGWRVRDVVGHLVSILEIPVGRFLLDVAKARSFDRYADRVAREFGDRDPVSLTDAFRSFADKRFAPPVIGPIAPLTDVVVHTRDIERPLGIAPTLDPDAVRSVLDYACGGKARGFVPAARTHGLRFITTDLGWSTGDGVEVIGTGEAILLAVTNRHVALADLTGAGAERLGQRLN